jgi:CHAD domain-containing protein
MSPLAAFLDTNAHTLLTLVPALRDGRVEAIHDARVATRRLRAALGIIESTTDHAHLGEAAQLARRAARALGRVRDLDVALELLADLERRAPAAAQAAAYARQALLRERTAARRRLVKKLDQLSLERLPALVRGGVPRLQRALAHQTRERAEALGRAVEHASGVYFPKRAHAARIEIKQLRYLIEFHDPEDRDALKLLRKSQELLGDIQDRQVVQGIVERLGSSEGAPPVDLDPLLAMLEAECVVLYDRFVERRADLLAVCARLAAPAPARPGLVAGTLLTAAAVVAGSLVQRHRARAPRTQPALRSAV